MDHLSFKEAVYRACLQKVEQRLQQLNLRFEEMRESLTSESKSTAGDKHETGRAMLQLEQEKLGKQLLETEKLKNLLNTVPYRQKYSSVASGAFVKTEDACYFISTGLGKLEVDYIEFFAISPASPIAQIMLRKTAGSQFRFNGKDIFIEEIF